MNNHAQPNSVTLPQSRDLFYGGRWHAPGKRKRMGTLNPATGEPLGEVGWADADDADQAVKAAYRGFQTWRAVKPLERAKILREAALLIRKHGRELALIDSANCGNPIREMVRDANSAPPALISSPGLRPRSKATPFRWATTR
jgi:betaine-aldehyde dehydrogenase